MSQTDLKNRLQKLINSSESLKLVSEKDRNSVVDRLLSATPEQMTKAISFFEGEQSGLQNIDEEIAKIEPEIQELTAELNDLSRKTDTEVRKVEESGAKAEDEKKAKELLKKLEEIV